MPGLPDCRKEAEVTEEEVHQGEKWQQPLGCHAISTYSLCVYLSLDYYILG
jgi:hypothetical protein